VPGIPAGKSRIRRSAIHIGGHITPALLEEKKITRDVSLSHTTWLWQRRRFDHQAQVLDRKAATALWNASSDATHGTLSA
jgi:hypothetical protein